MDEQHFGYGWAREGTSIQVYSYLRLTLRLENLLKRPRDGSTTLFARAGRDL